MVKHHERLVTSFEFRHATANDVDNIMDLWFNTPDDTLTIHQQFDPHGIYYEKDRNKFHQEAERYLELQIANGRVYLAQSPQGVVGCAIVQPELDQLDQAELAELFVHSQHRSQHIGRKLIQYAIQDLRQAGYRHLALQAHHNNFGARKLYRELGAIENSIDYIYGINIYDSVYSQLAQAKVIDNYEFSSNMAVEIDDYGTHIIDVATNEELASAIYAEPAFDDYFDNQVNLYITIRDFRFTDFVNTMSKVAPKELVRQFKILILNKLIGHLMKQMAKYNIKHLKVLCQPGDLALQEMLAELMALPNQCAMHFDLTDPSIPLISD